MDCDKCQKAVSTKAATKVYCDKNPDVPYVLCKTCVAAVKAFIDGV